MTPDPRQSVRSFARSFAVGVCVAAACIALARLTGVVGAEFPQAHAISAETVSDHTISAHLLDRAESGGRSAAAALDAPESPVTSDGSSSSRQSARPPGTPFDAAGPESGPLAAARFVAQQLRRSGDPLRDVDRLIEEMPDRELLGAITAFTNIRAEDLRDVRDVRDYARRLIDIALDGLPIGRAGTPEPAVATDVAEEAIPRVMFARAVDDAGVPLELRTQFDVGLEDRIYAVFPRDRYDGDQVLVRWVRIGGLLGEMVLFERYPIRVEEALSHVWVERAGGWPSGRYLVEFYDPAEPLERLAAGRYDIGGRPAF